MMQEKKPAFRSWWQILAAYLVFRFYRVWHNSKCADTRKYLEELKLMHKRFKTVHILHFASVPSFKCLAWFKQIPGYRWFAKVQSSKTEVIIYSELLTYNTLGSNKYPYTAQKTNFSIKDNSTFTEEMLNGKLYFLYSVNNKRLTS